MDVGRYILNYKGFMKNPHTKCLKLEGERPQLNVPMKVLCELSYLFSLYLCESFEEEIQSSGDRINTTR